MAVVVVVVAILSPCGELMYYWLSVNTLWRSKQRRCHTAFDVNRDKQIICGRGITLVSSSSHSVSRIRRANLTANGRRRCHDARLLAMESTGIVLATRKSSDLSLVCCLHSHNAPIVGLSVGEAVSPCRDVNQGDGKMDLSRVFRVSRRNILGSSVPNSP